VEQPQESPAFLEADQRHPRILAVRVLTRTENPRFLGWSGSLAPPSVQRH
jgi:hypothetical protein